jgi:hypothetical protein
MIAKLTMAALMLAVASGAGAAPEKPKKSAANDANKLVCESMGETGSRLARKRICMTKAEWDQMRQEDKMQVDRAQSQRPLDGN